MLANQDYEGINADAGVEKTLPILDSSSASQVLDGLATFFLLPESQVLLEEFDDGLGVAEILFGNLVDLVKSRLEGFLSKLAGTLLILHNFVVEHGEVKSKTKLDRVAGRKINLLSLGVCLKGLSLNLLELFTLSSLGNVTIVVTHHLNKESTGFLLAWLRKNLRSYYIDDFVAISIKSVLNFALVGGK